MESFMCYGKVKGYSLMCLSHSLQPVWTWFKCERFCCYLMKCNERRHLVTRLTTSMIWKWEWMQERESASVLENRSERKLRDFCLFSQVWKDFFLKLVVTMSFFLEEDSCFLSSSWSTSLMTGNSTPSLSLMLLLLLQQYVLLYSNGEIRSGTKQGKLEICLQ